MTTLQGTCRIDVINYKGPSTKYTRQAQISYLCLSHFLFPNGNKCLATDVSTDQEKYSQAVSYTLSVWAHNWAATKKMKT
jgi:hypothetical protein